MLIDSKTKYLDPKADLTLKRVFGQHPDLLISLLNSLLPLGDDQQIKSVTYLPTELVPRATGMKNTIVDVLCKDVEGRKFTVEMQMEWTNSFMKRVLFNASKLYVSQAEEGYDYANLQPVYSLNLVNDIFLKDVPDCKHDYKIVHDKYSDKVIEGLHFTFIELPKFTPQTMLEKRMAVLWLRFLTEINANTTAVPEELAQDPEINKAINEVRVSAFSEDELRAYDKFWDIVRTNKMMLYDSFEDGMAKGMAKGKEEGLAEGRAETRAKSQKIARNLLRMGLTEEQTAKATGLTIEDVKALGA